MSAGASQSQQTAEGSSFGLNTASSQSNIAAEQLPFLQNLWQGATGQANPGQVQATQQGLVDQTMPGLSQSFQNAVGLGDATAQIQAQTDSLQSGLSDLWNNTINPSITQGAIGSGQLGGSRQGVAQGVGAGQLGQAFTQGLGDITSRANSTALAAQGQAGNLAQQMFGLGSAPGQAGMDIYAKLASILGGPTILNNSQAFGFDQSNQSSQGSKVAANFGII